MDPKLKHRLIGAVIIAALAIILIPVLFDGDEEERIGLTRHIPPAPSTQLVPFDPDQLVAKMEAIESESQSRLPADDQVPTEPGATVHPESLSLDSSGLPVSWSLQVASFKADEKAVRLRDQLRERGYQSYRTHVDTEQGSTSRVLVGPMLQRSRLEEIQVKIAKEFGLDGKIIRYATVDDRELVGG